MSKVQIISSFHLNEKKEKRTLDNLRFTCGIISLVVKGTFFDIPKIGITYPMENDSKNMYIYETKENSTVSGKVSPMYSYKYNEIQNYDASDLKKSLRSFIESLANKEFAKVTVYSGITFTVFKHSGLLYLVDFNNLNVCRTATSTSIVYWLAHDQNFDGLYIGKKYALKPVQIIVEKVDDLFVENKNERQEVIAIKEKSVNLNNIEDKNDFEQQPSDTSSLPQQQQQQDDKKESVKPKKRRRKKRSINKDTEVSDDSEENESIGKKRRRKKSIVGGSNVKKRKRRKRGNN